MAPIGAAADPRNDPRNAALPYNAPQVQRIEKVP